MDENITRMAFAAVGAGLVIIAVMMRRLLSGQRVLDLTVDKLGLILKADAFGLIVFVGFVVLVSPIFFWYKGYEDKLSSLQTKVSGLEASIAVFKEHNLNFGLIFSENDHPDINRITWPPRAYVQRSGEREPKPYDLVNFVRGPGGVVASFKKLHSEDTLYVVVQEGNKKWQSFDMVVPAVELRMKEAETLR